MPWLTFVAGRLPELWLRTGEHLMLTGVSAFFAILIGIPLGILIARITWLRAPVTGLVGILQTVPSLALLVILLALFQKIGATPALVALTLYALLPIVRNTLTGIEGVPAASREAARGIGMTPRQRLFIVELPLAVPVIIAGVRTAAVASVGIATLSAFIGAGGLGQFINRGLALSNTNLILLGAIPAAILALLVDGSIAAFQRGMRHGPKALGPVLRPVALAMPAVLVIAGFAAYLSGTTGAAQAGSIRIGSKNFTEQLILGELMAQLIENRTELAVTRQFNLGGTMICHGALINDEIDLYAEYTGTALTTILEKPVQSDPQQVYDLVSAAYRQQFNALWLQPFGFDNTYALTVRADDGYQTISDLIPAAPRLTAGFTAEFAERQDGYPGLRRAYGLQFAQVRDLDPSLMYPALAAGEVDVISAFATDGRIAAFHLKPLADDRHFFPPYQAAPVVRIPALEAHPELRDVLALTAGLLDDETMRRLNYEVDGNNRRPADVVTEFLKNSKL